MAELTEADVAAGTTSAVSFGPSASIPTRSRRRRPGRITLLIDARARLFLAYAPFIRLRRPRVSDGHEVNTHAEVG
jgi:hypothetical protein